MGPEIERGARPGWGCLKKLQKDRRGNGLTHDKRGCPADEGYDNTKPLGRPIAENERVESVDAHRDDEEK
jgi:hypothetical protein